MLSIDSSRDLIRRAGDSRRHTALVAAILLTTASTMRDAAAFASFDDEQLSTATIRLNYRPGPAVDGDSTPHETNGPDSSASPRSAFGDDPFAARSTVWTINTAYSRDAVHAHIYLTQFSAGYYLYDNFAVHLGGTFGYVDADASGRSGMLGGPELRFQWHFLRSERWSTYLDGSVGAVFHQRRLTEDSLPFNFNLQAGVGATYLLDDRTILQGGARWHHLSNARVKGIGRNIGYDGPMVYLGIMRPF